MNVMSKFVRLTVQSSNFLLVDYHSKLTQKSDGDLTVGCCAFNMDNVKTNKDMVLFQ